MFERSMLVLAALVSSSAGAQELGDAERGRELAHQVCSACHVIEPDQNTVAVDGVPSFMAIARGPNGTAESIDSIMLQPTHPEMPTPPLDVRDRGHVISYILSLDD